MYTLLCALCDSTVAVNHDNPVGLIGLIVVLVMLAQDLYRKSKAKKAAAEEK